MATKEDWLAARMRWEADPTVTESDIGRELDVSRAAVNSRKKRENWSRLSDQSDLARRAHDRADRAAVEKLAAEGQVSLVDKAEQLRTQTVEVAIDMRATILGKHRQELEGVRALAYEAIKEKNFDKAKLGKISAEALVIIQNAERKAWGLDVEEKETGKVKVIIERTESSGVS